MNALTRCKEKDISEVERYTSSEICHQPDLWMKVYRKMKVEKTALMEFREKAYGESGLRVILTGAGTSAFIGESLAGHFQMRSRLSVEAIATTDLITHPEMHFRRKDATLLVSFARSGDSPESVAATELADQVLDTVYHLIITCNKEGKLATAYRGKKGCCVLELPEESNDRSLAMTSSFTSMLLAGTLFSRLDAIDQLEDQVERLATYGRHILNSHASKLEEVSRLDFNHVVFLGAGPLLGIARESCLKVQELTDGRVIGVHDSFLGLRHGPMVVMNQKTLLVYLISSDEHVRRYETDLMKQVGETGKAVCLIGVSENPASSLSCEMSVALSPDDENGLESDFLPICAVLPGQMLGYYKSLQLGLSPDAPSLDGTISRVVKGVTIYDYVIE